MAEHLYTHEIDEAAGREDALARLAAFYEANGYEVTHYEGGAARLASYRRGKEGAGWWTNDMTELETVVDVEPVGDGRGLRLRYRVDVTGQRLKDEEREVWRREATAAAACVGGGAPQDLRPGEAARVQELERRMWAVRFTAVFVGLMVGACLWLLGLI